MGYEQAYATIESFHNLCCPADFIITDQCIKTARVEVGEGKLVFIDADGKNNVDVPLAGLKAVTGTRGLGVAIVRIGTSRDLMMDLDAGGASRLAAALTQFPELAEAEWSAAAILPIIARAYRSLPVKPVPGEDVRELTVQAKDAIENKRFADAVVLYNRAMVIAPWWPAGHHNRAFIFAELGQFHYAALDMEAYLELVPDAPDARAMRDQVYVWRGRDSRVAPEPNPQWFTAPAEPGKPRLGAQVAVVPPIVAVAGHLPNTDGALVVSVLARSPAAVAGLHSGDIVIAVAGHPVMAPADMLRAVQTSITGTAVPVTIIRDGRQQTVSVRL